MKKESCLFGVCIKITAALLIMLILAALIYVGIRQKSGILEKIGKIVGTKAEIEEVAAMDMTKVDLVPDKNKVNVPVPKGYVLSGASDENDVTKGAVIYEGTTAVTDSNVATAKTTRNQWVWVPVSATNVSRIYSEDSYGRKFGKLYEYSSRGRTEGKTSSVEPGVLVSGGSADNEENFQKYSVYGYTQSKLYDEMQKNYEETIESIKTYGGFYIGRYETGDLSKRKPVVKQYNEDIYGQTWYTMYSKAQYVGANASVKSMMIYGSLWDEVLMWLYESGAKSYYEIGENSEDWGNYYNADFYYYTTETATNTSHKASGFSNSKLLPTGARAILSSNNWKRNCANNIYDLAGNVYEFTQVYYVSIGRLLCGGMYDSQHGYVSDYGWEFANDYLVDSGMRSLDYGTRLYLIL